MSSRKATGRTAFGVPLQLCSDEHERAIKTIQRKYRLSLPKGERATPITFGDPGCNVGGSGLRRLRFHSGQLRNRIAPTLYRQDGTTKARR